MKGLNKIIWVNISLQIQIYKDLLPLGLSSNLSKLSPIFSESFRFFSEHSEMLGFIPSSKAG